MIHDTLLKLDLPAQLRERITEFHEFRMKRMGGYTHTCARAHAHAHAHTHTCAHARRFRMEANIFFDELSPKIQLETRSEVNMTLLRAQDIFERLPEPCVAKLALCVPVCARVHARALMRACVRSEVCANTGHW